MGERRSYTHKGNAPKVVDNRPTPNIGSLIHWSKYKTGVHTCGWLKQTQTKGGANLLITGHIVKSQTHCLEGRLVKKSIFILLLPLNWMETAWFSKVENKPHSFSMSKTIVFVHKLSQWNNWVLTLHNGYRLETIYLLLGLKHNKPCLKEVSNLWVVWFCFVCA